MRTLAIETATAACSVALIEDGRVVDYAHEIVERGHAERLLPMIAALDRGGRADRIVVDVGPGSFTGVRVGVAAARALGFGWGVPVTGFHSLALIAASDTHGGPKLVAIEGGHGQVFVARYDALPLREAEAARSMSRDEAMAMPAERIIGNAALSIAAARADTTTEDIGPDARSVARLPAELCTLAPTPFYGREADAKPMKS